MNEILTKPADAIELLNYDVEYFRIEGSVNDLAQFCFTQSARQGWWDGLDVNDPYVVATKIGLIHSEVSEAFEGHRRGAMDAHLPCRTALEVELADALIRIADLAGRLGLDLGGAVVEKLRYNLERADHKPENRAKKVGGKKF